MREDLYNDDFIEEDIYQDDYYEEEVGYDFDDERAISEKNEDDYYEEDEDSYYGEDREEYEIEEDDDEASFNLFFPRASENESINFINNKPIREEDLSGKLPEYKGEDYEPPEDGNFFTDVKEFWSDWSPKGAFLKGVIIFIISLFIFLYAMAPLVTGLFKEKAVYNPISILIRMFGEYYIFGMIGFSLALALAVVITFLKYQSKKKSGGDYVRSKNKTYGDMKWAEEEDLVDAVKFTEKDRPTDTVLGLSEDYHKSLSLDIKIGNHNVLVMGASGSGKTYTFVLPNILKDIDQGNSFIVTDPPGKTYEQTSRLASKSHEVRVLNLKKLEASDGWDMLKIIKDLKNTNDAQTEVDNLVKTIMDNATGDDVKSDPYFDNIEKNLFTAIVNYVALSPNFLGEEYERHIGSCYDILIEIMANSGSFPIFDALPNSDPCKTSWKAFAGYGQKQKESAMSGLEAKIHNFQNEMLKEIFSHDEIDLALPGKKPCAYYIISSVTTSTFQFVLSLFFSSLIQVLITEADANGGRLSTEVNIYLDEFKAIGRISGFADKLANVRKYGINLIPIVQDISQIDSNYKGQRDTIMSNCDTWVVLGVNDNTTAKIISDKIGTMTIVNETIRREKARLLPVSTALSENVSVSDGKRLGLPPDEVQRLRSQGYTLVLTNSRFPYKSRYYPYPIHYLASYIDDPKNQHNAANHVPKWQEEEKTADKYHTFRDPNVVGITGNKVQEMINGKDKGKKEEPKKRPVMPVQEDSKTLSMDIFDTYEENN